MKRFRSILFWLHLVLGLAAGLVIAIVAVTGAALSFEDRIIAWAERPHVTFTAASPDARPLPLDELLARAAAERPTDRVTALVIPAATDRLIGVRWQNAPTDFIHPHTGALSARATGRLDHFFTLMIRWHRWLGVPQSPRLAPGETAPPPGFWNRTFTRSLVGYSTGVLLVLCVSGLWLWWPKNLTRRAFQFITVPRFSLRGRLRDWQWHNVFGFWSALPLIVISLTGVALTFPTVRDFLYPTGPEKTYTITAPARGTPPAPAAAPGAIFARSVAEIPDWSSMLFYLPRRDATGKINARPLTIYVYRADRPSVSTPLRFDPFTGALLEHETFASLPWSAALRALNRDIHTGAAFGWIGELIGCLVSLVAVYLVYSGVALAWRRFFPRRPAQP